MVVITPNATYLICRQKGYYCPIKRKGVYVIEPVDVEFSVVNISAEKLTTLEKQHGVAIIQTDDPSPDMHELRIKFDLLFYEKVAGLFNRYA